MHTRIALICALVASNALVIPVSAVQSPGLVEEHETFVSVTCGRDGAWFEETLPDGKVVTRHEQKYESEDDAAHALDEALADADVLSRAPATDKSGEVVGIRVEVLEGTSAVEIQTHADWLITVKADSLDSLRQYQEIRRARELRQAPPN